MKIDLKIYQFLFELTRNPSILRFLSIAIILTEIDKSSKMTMVIHSISVWGCGWRTCADDDPSAASVWHTCVLPAPAGPASSVTPLKPPARSASRDLAGAVHGLRRTALCLRQSQLVSVFKAGNPVFAIASWTVLRAP